jgi:pyruvate-formate lyase-activating enzyme
MPTKADWPVVPLSPGQLLDVRDEDVLCGGLYRLCHTYRGGGGYDRFPDLCEELTGVRRELQFVVQLQACPLDCPYCYVTRAGVWGEPVMVPQGQLVADYARSGASVLHLMGGAPALYMARWPALLTDLLFLGGSAFFHSDLMLVEGLYDRDVLAAVARARSHCLLAVNVKGFTDEEWLANTRRPARWGQFWENWRRVEAAGVPAYVTFTACDRAHEDDFWSRAASEGLDVGKWRPDAYHIDLIEYDALPYVDDVAWGNKVRPSIGTADPTGTGGEVTKK